MMHGLIYFLICSTWVSGDHFQSWLSLGASFGNLCSFRCFQETPEAQKVPRLFSLRQRGTLNIINWKLMFFGMSDIYFAKERTWLNQTPKYVAFLQLPSPHTEHYLQQKQKPIKGHAQELCLLLSHKKQVQHKIGLAIFIPLENLTYLNIIKWHIFEQRNDIVSKIL